jgi:mono/diheme cytochrome c family protein
MRISTRLLLRLLVALLLLLALAAVAVVLLNRRGEDPLPDSPAAEAPATPDQVARGAYLARTGNCASCHSAPGGASYAGGIAVPTPFGAIYSSNLTPDLATGIGNWSRAQFWRALHNGRSADGRLLYPAFPYTNYTEVTREDADALLAFLQSQPAASQANRAPDLRFPYDTQAALAVWRALYFRPGSTRPDPAQTAEWNRGAYLVRGLGHCSACHSPRNALGASADAGELRGGLIAAQDWYAPSLRAAAEAGVAQWSADEVVELLRTGVNRHAGVMGPMAEVVFSGSQHLSEPDLRAMAAYLRALPPLPPAPPREVPVAARVLDRGKDIYRQQCAQCHGDQGEGQPGRYPALAGNRAVLLAEPANLLQAILHGGFAPATAGNPRPYGMPPFAQVLEDADVAAVTSFVRLSWGNHAGGVEPLEVYRIRDSAR